MSRIAVYDIAADSGGALSILQSYYDAALNDSHNSWLFLVSTVDLESKNNIKILKFPWVKKSWIHRLFFDIFIARRIIKNNRINKVISLQNIIIWGAQCKQEVYLHQTLPFADKRYSLRENTRFWIYQNLISRLIFISIKRASCIYVQTHWLANEVVQKIGIHKSRIIVEPPSLPVSIKKYRYRKTKTKTFLYPAAPYEYKNHQIILDAVRLIPKADRNFTVIFTFRGNENRYAQTIKNFVHENDFPIKFKPMSQRELFKTYETSTLLFPSTLESYGLPLAEARAIGSPIIAADSAFSREILKSYSRYYPYRPNSIRELVNLLKANGAPNIK